MAAGYVWITKYIVCACKHDKLIASLDHKVHELLEYKRENPSEEKVYNAKS